MRKTHIFKNSVFFEKIIIFLYTHFLTYWKNGDFGIYGFLYIWGNTQKSRSAIFEGLRDLSKYGGPEKRPIFRTT